MDRRGFLISGAAFAGLAGAARAAEHGLVPDLGTDQSGRLERALEAAGPDPLFLGPGRYRLAGARLPDGAGLIGVAGQTIIEQADSGPVLSTSGAERITLAGLTFEGGESAEPLVLIEATRRAVIADCAFRDAGAIALQLTQSGGAVTGCLFERSGTVALYSLDATGLEIASNVVRGCGDNGILVWTSEPAEDGTIVSNNRIEDIEAESGGTGQYGNAILVFRARGVTISGNVARSCAFSGVRINSGGNCLILGNNIADMRETAIFVEFAFDGAVVANNVVDGAAGGISITNFSTDGGRLAACSGNVVRNIDRRRETDGQGGFGIHAEGDAAVTGNVIEACFDIGLSLGWGESLRDVAASGNVVRDCGTGISVSVARGVGRASLANNVVSGSARGAVLAMEWDRVVADLMAEPERFPTVTLTGNSVG